MNILISGATGLIGTQLCQKLQHHNLYKVSHSSVDFPFDIANKEKVLKAFKTKIIDVIIHLANPPDWYSQDPSYYLPANIIGTINLIELAKLKQARFIFVSSQTVYGAHHLHRGLTEKTQRRPKGWYGLSKYMAEQYLELFHQLTQLPITIFRPVGIFGNGDTRTLVGKFINLAKTNKPLIIFGHGHTKHHFLHVEDAAEAIVKSLRVSKGLEIFNLGSFQVVSHLKIAQFIAQLKPVPIVHQGKEDSLDFYLNTQHQQRVLGLKPDLFFRIKQELS
jgi:nucleoside-diphosphate-sugar epimerase